MPEEVIAVFNVRPGGSVRGIYHDDFKEAYEKIGCRPQTRGSIVDPIPAGPCARQWFVDMSPLGSEFHYCLWPPFQSHAEALMAEQQHIYQTWIKGGSGGIIAKDYYNAAGDRSR